MFGQIGAAQSHLANQGVGKGDLFLFYGWFRQSVEHNEGLDYVRGSDGFHTLWGYLQVGEVWPVRTTDPPVWATSHPHFKYDGLKSFTNPNNTVYVARERLSFDPRLPGSGSLGAFRPQLRLTKQGSTRSVWDLPICFDPIRGSHMSYNLSQNFIPSEDGRQTVLTANRIGQEFVVDPTVGLGNWITEVLEGVSSAVD